MRYLSLFSGIEAATVAWAPLDWTCVGVAEIEAFPCSVLQHHYPDVPNLGDVSKITEKRIAALGQIDLIVGGFPCQDLSVAGKRRGLNNKDGSRTRSGLFFDAMRLVRFARERCGLRWLVIENVPGLYSSHGGRDFASVVGEMAGVGFGVPPGGWENTGVAIGPDGKVEWATLDAQWFGLAQRRNRVFLVGDFGDWTRSGPVLLEQESLLGNPPPRREAREDAARGPEHGADADGVAHCLSSSNQRYDWETETLIPGVANPLGAKHDGGWRGDLDNDTYVTHSLRADGFDASEDGTGRGTPLAVVPIQNVGRGSASQNGAGIGKEGEPMFTLDQASTHAIIQPYTLAIRGRGDSHELEYRQDGTANALLTPNGGRGGIGVGAIAFSCKDHGADAGDLAPTLRAMAHSGSHANAGGQVAIAFDWQKGNDKANPRPSTMNVSVEQSQTLGSTRVPAVAFGWQNSSSQGDSVSEHVTPTLDKSKTPAIAFDRVQITSKTNRSKAEDGLPASTLSAGSDMHVAHRSAVRRLTPKECARLQGFPDTYLNIIHKGKPAADGNKYRALGNSFAVPVVRYIGERIAFIMQQGTKT